jgi:hypothetical protein
VAEHALGQVAGDRGDLGVSVAQVEDEAGRAARWCGGQLRFGDDGRGRIGQDELLSSRRDGWIPGRSQRCVDRGIDADGVLAGRNGPAGRTAGAAGGRRWVRSTAQPSAVNAEAEAVLDDAAWNIGDQSAVTAAAAGPRGSPPAPSSAVACWPRPVNRRG